MKYMLLIYIPTDVAPETLPSTETWFSYTQELAASGALVAGDGLQGADTATSVRTRDGETLITDGPFAETKELLGGYYVVDVEDLDAALAWAAKVPVVGVGTVEVRPVMVYDQ